MRCFQRSPLFVLFFPFQKEIDHCKTRKEALQDLFLLLTTIIKYSIIILLLQYDNVFLLFTVFSFS